MADDEVIIRARLIDELSEPADRVEDAIDDLADSHRRASDGTDEHTESMNKNSDAMGRNEKAAKSNKKAVDDSAKGQKKNTDATNEYTEAASRLGQMVKKNTKNMSRMTRTLLKGAGIITLVLGLVGPLSTGVAALASGAMAAVSGLSPLVGTLLPIPALLSGMVQGLVAAKLGFSGMGTAIAAVMAGDPAAIAEAMKDLGPNTRDAATAMGELAKSYQPIRESVQERMWENMARPIKLIGEQYLPIVTRGMNLTGDAMNKVLHNLAGFMLLEQTQARIGRIMVRNAAITESFGNAGVASFRVFIALADAAGDTAVRMARDFAKWMDDLAVKIETNSARIGAFADRAYNLFLRVKDALTDWGVALFNVFRATIPLSNSLGASFAKIGEEFRKWTENPENFQKMVGYFERMQPVLSKLWTLTVELGAALIRLSDNPNFGKMLDMFIQAVPALEGLASSASGLMVPLASIIVSLIQIADNFNIFGPVSAILWAIAGILHVVAAALNAIPDPIMDIIAFVVIWGLAIRKVHAVLQALGFSKGLAPILGWIIKIVAGFGKMAGAALMAGAKMALAWLIGLGPIGWVIIAIMAVVAVFVLLYMKCEWFRNAVQAVWEAIKAGAIGVWNGIKSAAEGIGNAWNSAVESIKNAWNSVVSFFQGIWNGIVSGATTAGNWIKTAWNGVTSFFSELISAIGNAFSVGWNYIKAMVAPVVSFIVAVWGGIVGLFQAVWNVIISIFQLAWAVIRLIVNVAIAVIGFIIQGLVNLVMSVLNPIISFFQMAWQIIQMLVGIAIEMIKVKIQQIMAVVQFVLGIVQSIFSAAWSVITSIVSSAVSAIGAVINVISSVVSAVLGVAQGIFSAIWAAIVGIVQGAISGMAGIINTITGIVSGVMNTVSGIWNSVWSGMQSFVMGIINAITGALNGIASVVSSITSGISNVASKLPGLAAGGTVTSGMTAMIGEVGPEAFVSSTGKVTPIGLNGPDIMKFPTSGYVVPNHVLAGHADASVPGNVMKQLEAATMGGGGRREAAHGGEYLEDGGAGGSTQVIIQGDVYGMSDLEAKITRAVNEAEKARRRRR